MKRPGAFHRPKSFKISKTFLKKGDCIYFKPGAIKLFKSPSFKQQPKKNKFICTNKDVTLKKLHDGFVNDDTTL